MALIMHLNEISKYFGNLMRMDQIRAERNKSTVYYAATDRKGKGYARSKYLRTTSDMMEYSIGPDYCR